MYAYQVFHGAYIGKQWWVRKTMEYYLLDLQIHWMFVALTVFELRGTLYWQRQWPVTMRHPALKRVFKWQATRHSTWKAYFWQLNERLFKSQHGASHYRGGSKIKFKSFLVLMFTLETLSFRGARDIQGHWERVNTSAYWHAGRIDSFGSMCIPSGFYWFHLHVSNQC